MEKNGPVRVAGARRKGLFGTIKRGEGFFGREEENRA